VLGGLPKYKKFFAPAYIEANPDSGDSVAELRQLIINTISYGELCLNIALDIQPGHDLLVIMQQEQLPKLKALFDMPVQPIMRKKSNQVSEANGGGNQLYQLKNQETMIFQTDQQVSSTPKAGNPGMSKQASTISDTSHNNRSFLKHLTTAESYSGRAILSYLTGGGNNSVASSNNNYHSMSNDKLSNQLSFTNRSHRDSVTSVTSEDVLNNTQSTNGGGGGGTNKIVLDETVNPKRPLRPTRAQTHKTSSSGLNSPNNVSQNSRPMSHLSGVAADETGSNFNSITNLLNIQDIHVQDDELSEPMEQQLLFGNGPPLLVLPQPRSSPPPPPPKPPKLVKMSSTPIRLPVRQSPVMSNGYVGFNQNGSGAGQINGGSALSNGNGCNGKNGSFSTENLLKVKENTPDLIIAAQSSASLNSMQFKYLTSKATSDLILNKVSIF
jgi:hypothetical protein